MANVFVFKGYSKPISVLQILRLIYMHGPEIDEMTSERILKLIEQQNMKLPLMKSNIAEGKSKLTAQSQALIGIDLFRACKSSKHTRFSKEMQLSHQQEMDHIAGAGMAKAQLMLGNLSKARELAESAYEENPDELLTKIALASVLSEQLLHLLIAQDELFSEAMAASRESSLAGGCMLRFAKEVTALRSRSVQANTHKAR